MGDSCEVEDKQSLPMTGETAGLDFGLKTFLTVSDGSEVVSPDAGGRTMGFRSTIESGLVIVAISFIGT